ncbi:lysophospholipase L1-like esterase [Kitasatospora sp. MAA4]|uniref:SGNH/GDSL hydrolase family protein n=1 Tax=Kitasatospora sp. MAA4 TaxID=3035093 RepID=UPI002473F4FF|nr:SGNH/GDSL hydrolase family protein [Kitasatospora sp. MAA4]MDH6132746.1 lysophospholipase L1-like esterase [Kitasatospora sp. MAA4]
MTRLLLTGIAVVLATSNPALGFAGAAAAQPAATVIRVMPLGDSITVGQGSLSGNGYRADLRDLVADQTAYAVQFVGDQTSGTMTNPQHEGHGYYMVDDVRHGVDSWLAAARPDVVLLNIGTNDLDWRPDPDPDHAADRLEKLVDQIFTDAPNVTVVMEGLITNTGGLQDRVRQYNDRARELALVEQLAGKHFLFAGGATFEPRDFADRLHPTDSGYQKMADAFFPPLQQALTGGWVITKPSSSNGETAARRAPQSPSAAS